MVSHSVGPRCFFLFKKSCQESGWVLRELRLSMWILTIRVTWSWNTKMFTNFANVYKCDLFDFDLLWFVCFSQALICIQFLKSDIRKKDGLIFFLRESRESRTSVRLQTVQQIQTGAVWTLVAIQRCSTRLGWRPRVRGPTIPVNTPRRARFVMGRRTVWFVKALDGA